MSVSSKPTNSSPSMLDEPERLIQGVFEPPNSFVMSAIRRNILIVCAFAIGSALIGAGYQLSRPRTYTATATLQVGQVNPNSPGFFSYLQSATALSTAFSRSISAEPVLATVQQKLKIAPAKALARLSSEPIPLSPVFNVIATGPTEAGAVQLANVAAGAIITYESQSNSANPESASLLNEYRSVSVRLQQIAAKVEGIEYGNRKRGVPRNTPVAGNALADAQAEKDAIVAKLKAIDAAYTAAVASQAPRSGLVSLLAGATSASGDRKSKVELFGFIGLLVGIVVGCVVAVLREQRRVNRPTSGVEIETHRPEQA
jgi:uncharacterized protein involved in exopolysaccharide biosynthesis